MIASLHLTEQHRPLLKPLKHQSHPPTQHKATKSNQKNYKENHYFSLHPPHCQGVCLTHFTALNQISLFFNAPRDAYYLMYEI